jgi:hypothetical protein
MILERFKVPVKDQVFVSEAALRRTVAQIFEKLGLTAEDAAEGADVLTVTDLRGVGDARRVEHAPRLRPRLQGRQARSETRLAHRA